MQIANINYFTAQTKIRKIFVSLVLNWHFSKSRVC